MFHQYPFTASPHSIALFFRGKMRNIPSTDPSFPDLYEHLKLPKHDEVLIERLVDKPALLERLTVGEVKVVGNGVLYKGHSLHTTLAEKLLRMVDAGFDATNWARFLGRVMENPSERSRTCLYDFLQHWNAPITEDGCFIAFKRVRGDYRDIRSGTFDNSPGQIVEMPREKVNDDPNQTCSYGLHVAATSYLGHFYSTTSGYRVVACKVDPADVVAVPYDYNGAKMRVCKYLVLGDAEEAFYNGAEELHVYEVSSLVKGALTDIKGRHISADAVTFSQDWRRDIYAEIAEGTTVAPTAYSGDDLPSNKFMVGVVTASIKNDEGQFVDVEWQDGSTSATLRIDRATPLNSDVVAVTYVGAAPSAAQEAEAETVEAEVCDECGNADAAVDGLCVTCNAEEEADDMEAWRATTDALDEADHIAETGLTRAGEVPTEAQAAQAAGFNAFYGAAPVEQAAASERTFAKDGVTYTASAIKDGVKNYGQRGYSRLTGIPRTTLQEWLKAL